MDIKQINALFLPFNIEVICECCQQMGDTHIKEKRQDAISMSLFSNFKIGNEKPETGQLPVRQKLIRKARTAVKRRPGKENQKNSPNILTGTAQFASPGQFRTTTGAIPKFPVYPPNQILNLNLLDSSISKQKDIGRILEDSMRTPFKIGEVEFEKGLYSEKKQSNKNNFTHSTVEGFVFEFEDFGEFKKQEREANQGKCRFEDQIALSSVPSRDYSPCDTPVKFIPGTPSRSARTPNSMLSVSPFYAQHFYQEGKRKKDSDFPMNLFYDAI